MVGLTERENVNKERSGDHRLDHSVKYLAIRAKELVVRGVYPDTICNRESQRARESGCRIVS